MQQRRKSNIDEKVFPFRKSHDTFISDKGYVFIIRRGEELECKRKRKNITKRIVTYIDHTEYDLLNLMLEYFFQAEYSPDDRVSFMYTNDLRIPAKSIKIKRFKKRTELTKEEEIELMAYNCDKKAANANMRCEKRITPLHVYETIKITDFRCVYCGDKLVKQEWHLDHFTSLSTGGQNEFSNLAPACKRCNLMKHILDGFTFIRLCKKIILNNLIDENFVAVNEEKEEKLKIALDNIIDEDP